MPETENARLTNAMEELGLGDVELPRYMLENHDLLLQILQGPRLNCNFDNPKAWLMERFAAALEEKEGVENDEDFDMVDDLGGVDEAREFIKSCWSLVSVPSTQLQMIELLKEAGFTEYDSQADGIATMVRGTEAGRPGTHRSGHGHGDGSDDGSDHNVGDNHNTDRNKKNKPKISFFHRVKPSKPQAPVLVIINRRHDAGRKPKDYCEMELNETTTVGDVKTKVYETWGVERAKQSFCVENILLEDGDDSRLIKDVGPDVGPAKRWFLQHQTKTGKLIATPSMMSPWWPARLLWNWIRGNCYRLSFVYVDAEDLFDKEDPEDKRFAPEFSAVLSLQYDAKDMLVREVDTVSLHTRLYFGVDENLMANFDGIPGHTSGQRRGYFVTSLEMCFHKEGAPLKFTEATDEPAEIEFNLGETRRDVAGGKITASASKIFEMEGKAELELASSNARKAKTRIRRQWAVQAKKGGWKLLKRTWDYMLAGFPLDQYPMFGQDGKIPEVSTSSTELLVAKFRTPKGLLTLPTIIETVQGDGKKRDRDAAAMHSLRVTMMLRKLYTRHRTRYFHEYSDSPRRVTMQGDVPLMVFPETLVRWNLLFRWSYWAWPVIIGIMAIIAYPTLKLLRGTDLIALLKLLGWHCWEYVRETVVGEPES